MENSAQPTKWLTLYLFANTAAVDKSARIVIPRRKSTFPLLSREKQAPRIRQIAPVLPLYYRSLALLRLCIYFTYLFEPPSRFRFTLPPFSVPCDAFYCVPREEKIRGFRYGFHFHPVPTLVAFVSFPVRRLVLIKRFGET